MTLVVASQHGFLCPGCGSRLKVSGLFEASLKGALITPIIGIPGSWLLISLSLVLCVGLFVLLVKKYAKVSLVEN
jgi:hypothetical protein